MRKRMAIAALAVVIAAALGAALVGFLHERSSAERRKKETQSLRSVERTDQISSIIGPTLPALAGLESYRLSPTLEARKRESSMSCRRTRRPAEDSVRARRPGQLGRLGRPDDAGVRKHRRHDKLWNRSGAPLKTLETTADVNHIAVGRDRGGTLLAAAESDGRVELWRVARPGGNRLEIEPLRVKGKALVSGNTDGAGAVALGRVGNDLILAAGGDDCRIALWK